MAEKRSGRPLGVSILAVLVFGFAAWNGLRMCETIFYWNTLQEYGVHPLYISMSGASWFIIGLLLVWGLWQRLSWGWMATIGGAAAYSIWYWLDRLVLQKPHVNWPFALVGNIIFLILIFSLIIPYKTKRDNEKVAYERKS